MTYFYQFLMETQTQKVFSQKIHDEILALQMNHPQSLKVLILDIPRTTKFQNLSFFTIRKPSTYRTQQCTRLRKRDFQLMQLPRSLRLCSLQWPFNSLGLIVIDISGLICSVIIQDFLGPFKSRCHLRDFLQKLGLYKIESECSKRTKIVSQFEACFQAISYYLTLGFKFK